MFGNKIIRKTGNGRSFNSSANLNVKRLVDIVDQIYDQVMDIHPKDAQDTLFLACWQRMRNRHNFIKDAYSETSDLREWSKEDILSMQGWCRDYGNAHMIVAPDNIDNKVFRVKT